MNEELVGKRVLRVVFDRISLTRSNKRYNECNEGNEAQFLGQKCAENTPSEVVHLNATAAKLELANCFSEKLKLWNQCSRSQLHAGMNVEWQ